MAKVGGCGGEILVGTLDVGCQRKVSPARAWSYPCIVLSLALRNSLLYLGSLKKEKSKKKLFWVRLWVLVPTIVKKEEVDLQRLRWQVAFDRLPKES